MTPQGWVRVLDGLTIGEWHDNKHGSSHTRPPTDYDADHLLVRVIECIQGMVQVEIVCEPMLDYGASMASWTMVDEGDEGDGGVCRMDATGTREERPAERREEGGRPDGIAFRLFSDIRMGIEGNRAHGRHTMVEGERRFCAISWTEALGGPGSADEALGRIEATSHYWREWLAEGSYPDHPWRYHLQRSALTLKGLTFMPTGALVAAPTTSLPETPRGERNWDYRYCWMRDASFTLWGLHALGLDWEADDFIQYLADLERNEDGSLQIMYGIRGQKDLEESTLDHLKGYEGARPVRIGNGAYAQRQNDVYGAVLDSVYLHSKNRDHIPERLWPVLTDQVECAAKVWREPDQGIWEARGAPRHYVSSKLMCWVALDRGARLAERRGLDDLASGWQALARRDQGRHPDEGGRRARRVPPALRNRRARRLHAADPAGALPAARRRTRARDRHGDQRGAHRRRACPALPHRGDRRRPARRGGHVPDLLVLARLGALGDRRGTRSRAPVRAPALLRLAARPLRRGARGLIRAPPRQLPAGLHAPRPDQRGHPRRSPSRGPRRGRRVNPRRSPPRPAAGSGPPPPPSRPAARRGAPPCRGRGRAARRRSRTRSAAPGA